VARAQPGPRGDVPGADPVGVEGAVRSADDRILARPLQAGVALRTRVARMLGVDHSAVPDSGP
jgi:hypothetical protein